jgi:hypothetical protein
MSKRVELHPDFAMADAINAPHHFAYKFAFEVLFRSVSSAETKSLFRDTECQLNTPLAWSPDGSTLYHAYDQIYAVNPLTGSTNAVTAFPEQFSVNHHLYCSPDGQRLVFLRTAAPPPHLACRLGAAPGAIPRGEPISVASLLSRILLVEVIDRPGAVHYLEGRSTDQPRNPYLVDGRRWSEPPPDCVVFGETWSRMRAVPRRPLSCFRLPHSIGPSEPGRLGWIVCAKCNERG